MAIIDILARPGTPDLDWLTTEAGGHRVQRIPNSDRSGRVHSSTVTVSVLDQEDTNLNQEWDAIGNEFQVSFYSGTGPGGQNRNKVQASARIVHIPTGLTRTSQTRSRKNSVAIAMDALKEDLAKLSLSQRQSLENGNRRDQIGSGMRGDKKRTYRFQEGRVHDHESSRTTDLRKIMSGDFTDLWK